MGTDSYVREKLSAGVSCLVGLGDIRSRVANAFFSMTTIQGKHFSNNALGKQFDDVYSKVTAVPAKGDEGTINATLATMSEEEASDIANKLLEIFSEMLRDT
ncbi:hypothetical protein [Agrobacterium leguminum]|uniref:hypothetical protein n=1 Tax=Agrobacterium leguminum TaxID=2792015 RepID=UPI003CE51C5D